MKTEKHVLFSIGTQMFAMSVSDVTDVLHNPVSTRIPLAASEIVGVLNMRGYIVTVLDMRVRLNIQDDKPKPDIDTPMCIVVVFRGTRYGFMVDYVHDVVDLSASLAAPVPPSLDPSVRAMAVGVYQHQKHLVLALDITKVVGISETLAA
ncbi:MAG: chemotaxis protein CheW [Alphaproteobacteria bacterium]